MLLNEMKYSVKFLVLYISTILISNFAFSQKKKSKYEKEFEKLNCVRSNKLSLENRALNYPYNISSQIKIISYKNKGEGFEGEELQKYLDLIISNKDSLNESNFDEIQILNTKQIERLTDLIYNYGFKEKVNTVVVKACYMPRNAILFYDNENNLIGFLEICFECNNYRSSNMDITIGELCKQKMQLMKEFFKDCGIKYGTD